MKRQILLLMAGYIFCWGCSDSLPDGWQGKDFMAFRKDFTDSTLFSFAYDETLKQGDVILEMDMLAPAVSYDRMFRVVFLPQESTGQEGVHFIKFPEEQIVPADSSRVSLHLTVLKSNGFTDRQVVAVFELQPTDDFQLAFPEKSKARLFISDQLSRPAWWDDWHVSSGLGTYSDKKYRLFIREVQEYDLDYENREDMDYYRMRSLVLKFKHWLQEHPQTEADGSLMTIAMRG